MTVLGLVPGVHVSTHASKLRSQEEPSSGQSIELSDMAEVLEVTVDEGQEDTITGAGVPIVEAASP